VQKRQNNILIFVLTLAGLLVAILYSPIGSPTDYSSLYFYSTNPGVQFQGGIANAPSTYSSVNYNEPELILPMQETSQRSIAMSTISGSTNSNENISSSAQINTTGNSKEQASHVVSGGPLVSASYYSRGGGTNASEAVTQQSFGFTSLSNDLTTANTTKQNTLSGAGGGGTDPGGDPTGPPIPVGEGWIFLLFLAGGYVIIKRFVLKYISCVN